MYKNILFEVKNKSAWITLNRPEVYNAFNDEMSYELQDVLKAVSRERDIRVVVLSGAGDKAFSSGQDLKEARKDKTDIFSDSLIKRYNPIIRAITGMPKPIICRLNGVAAGAGCSIALACDIILASEHAALVLAFIQIGLVPDSGASYLLPRLLGYRKAFEWATHGGKIPAKEALALGLVNKVVEARDLDGEVEQVAAYYAQAPARAVALIKKMLQRGLIHNLNDTLQYEAYCQQIAGETEDHQEGVTAFREKRKPHFKGL